MVLELVGSRILAPYLGTSIFVWTSLIGVILASLSLGYWWGGRLADRNPNFKTLSAILFASAILVGITTITNSLILTPFYFSSLDVRLSATIAALILFAPPSVLLGMVSPYAARLKIKDINTSGATVGNLYAISTVGSILGTFLGGFFLISLIGSEKVLFFLAAVLLFNSLLAFPGRSSRVIMPLILIIVSMFGIDYVKKQTDLIDLDTQYYRVWISDQTDDITQRPVRRLFTAADSSQSAMFLDRDDDLASLYTKYYRLAHHFSPNFKRSLMVGGGAYSYPKDYLRKTTDGEMDVVEIDPELTELAKKYFNLKDDPRLAIYHEDGRTYLNKTKKRYEVIFVDVFKSLYSIPYHLATKEAVQKMYDALGNNGIVLVNVISAIEGKKGELFRAIYVTYLSVFPQVYAFPVHEPEDGRVVQNIMLVALKSPVKPVFSNDNEELSGYLGHLWQNEIDTDLPVLTDDFAPVEKYLMGMI